MISQQYVHIVQTPYPWLPVSLLPYYSAWKPTLILPSTEDRKRSWPDSNGVQHEPRPVYHSGCHDKQTTIHSVIWTSDLSQR